MAMKLPTPAWGAGGSVKAYSEKNDTLWLFNIAMGNGPFMEVYLLIAWRFSMANCSS